MSDAIPVDNLKDYLSKTKLELDQVSSTDLKPSETLFFF